MKAIGTKQIAEAKKKAAIAQAEADKEEQIKTSEAKKIGEEAKLKSETAIEEAKKEKNIKLQQFKEEEAKAKAKADLAYEVEKNKVKKEVIAAENDAKLLEEQRLTEIAEQQSKKKEKELDAEVKKVAEANKYKEIQEAEGNTEKTKIESKAKAEEIENIGKAKANALTFEAEALKKRAEIFKENGQSIILETIANNLPEITKYISEPLSKIDNLTVIDNGGEGGASKVSRNVTNVAAELPVLIKALTGLDMIDMMSSLQTVNHNCTKETETNVEDNIEEDNETESNIKDMIEEDMNN